MSFEYEKAYRQGEVLFFKVKTLKGIRLPYHGKPIKIIDGVIREGEKEGHEHKVEGGQLTMFGEVAGKPEATEAKGNDVNGDVGVVQVLKEAARVTHPEHKEVKLPPGDYVTTIQKEAKGKHGSQSVKD